MGTIVLGLAVNEISDVSPWMAKRLVRWAAHLWSSDPTEAAGYAQEWQAVVNDRPGKLFKLFTALGFLAGAAGIRLRVQIRGRRRAAQHALRGIFWVNWLMGVSGTAMVLDMNGDLTSGHLWTLQSTMIIVGFLVAAGLEIMMTVRRRRRPGR